MNIPVRNLRSFTHFCNRFTISLLPVNELWFYVIAPRLFSFKKIHKKSAQMVGRSAVYIDFRLFFHQKYVHNALSRVQISSVKRYCDRLIFPIGHLCTANLII